jgi:hypothetical protein
MATLLTLKEFLALNRISRATFYRLPDKPRTVRISRDAVSIYARRADREYPRRLRTAALSQRRFSSQRSPLPHPPPSFRLRPV